MELKLNGWDVRHIKDFIAPKNYGQTNITLTRKLSEWTSGSGHYTRTKELPPYVHRAELYSNGTRKGSWPNKSTMAASAVNAFYKENSRCIVCLWFNLDDYIKTSLEAIKGTSLDETIMIYRG